MCAGFSFKVIYQSCRTGRYLLLQKNWQSVKKPSLTLGSSWRHWPHQRMPPFLTMPLPPNIVQLQTQTLFPRKTWKWKIDLLYLIRCWLMVILKESLAKPVKEAPVPPAFLVLSSPWKRSYFWMDLKARMTVLVLILWPLYLPRNLVVEIFGKGYLGERNPKRKHVFRWTHEMQSWCCFSTSWDRITFISSLLYF